MRLYFTQIYFNCDFSGYTKSTSSTNKPVSSAILQDDFPIRGKSPAICSTFSGTNTTPPKNCSFSFISRIGLFGELNIQYSAIDPENVI